MKKKLVFIFLGILTLLCVLYFLRYKRALVFEDKVPKPATEVIHVNLRQIEHHILVDAIKNPLKFIDFKLPTKKKDSLLLKKIISIPRNLFFYTNDAQFNGIWISSFIKIKKQEKLSAYLIRDGFVKSNDEDDVTLFNKKNVALAIKDKQLIVAFKENKEATISAVAIEVFNENMFLSETSDVLKSIVNSKSDISYAAVKDNFVEANFKNGLFEVLGTLHSDVFLTLKDSDFSKNSLGYISTKINKEHKLFKALIIEENRRKFNNFTKLSIDSIISKWSGNFALNLKVINSKKDTIVTYDYDDDFNKIEKIAVQELTVPEFDFSFDADSNLFGYLSNKNAIQVIESDTVFTSMPLYKLYASTTATALNIATQKDFSGFSMKENKIKLNAYLNIEKYMQKPLDFSFLPTNNYYFQLLKETSILYTTDNKLSIKLVLKNSERNFIGQLVKP